MYDCMYILSCTTTYDSLIHLDIGYPISYQRHLTWEKHTVISLISTPGDYLDMRTIGPCVAPFPSTEPKWDS